MKRILALFALAALVALAVPARAANQGGNSQGGNGQGGNSNSQGTVVAPEINPSGATAAATLLVGALAMALGHRRPA